MTKNGPNLSLNADAADAVFAGYSGPTRVTPSADGLPERHRETRLSENTIERPEKVAAAPKAQSIFQRVRGLLGSLFGSDGRRPRSRSRSYRSEYAYVSMLRAERLEERLCMSASPVAAEVGSMFTDTTHTQLEQDIEANLTAMYAELSQLDAQISGMPAALSLQWNPSSAAGWTGELAPQRTSWMHDSVLTGSGKFLVAGFQDGAIEIRSTETGAVLSTLNSGVGRSYFFSANPTNDIVYVSAGAGAGSKLIAIDAARGTELWRASGGDSANRSSVTADGKFVLVDIDNLGVATFDAQTGALLSRSQEQDYGGNAVGQDMTVFNAGRELWLQRKNGTRTLLATVDGMAYETAVSPDQQRIAVGGSGGMIVVVNIATGAQTRWTGHGASVTDVVFTDNQTLAVGHGDGTVELWDVSGVSPVKKTSLQTGQGYVYGMDAVNGVLVLRTGGSTPRWKALNYADTTQRDALVAERSDLQETITTEESRLTILEASATPDAVPYAFTLMDLSDSQNGSPESHELVTAPVSMQIARDGDMDTLSIKTPFDETHIPSPFGTLRFTHSGGTENQIVLRRHFSEMFNPSPSASPELTFTAYADAALTKAVFDVTLRIDRATGQVTISSGVPRSIERGMLPNGVEAEPAAALQIASVTGPNAIVMVSAQHDAVIRFAGVHDDGVLSRASVRGDGELRATSLTINTSNPTGDYALIMTDSDGRDLGRQNVHWDSDTKQLSVPGGIVWSGSPEADAEAQNVRMLMQDPGLGDRALSAAQGSLMVDMMDSLPAPYCHLIKSFDQAVLDAHPEWSDEALRAKAIATHGSFSITEAFDALVRNRNDEMRLLRSAYGTYQSLVGDLLKQASTLLSQIRSGGNENQLRHDFAVTVDIYSTGLAMTQLASIGIHIPNPDTLLAAAKCLWDVKGSQLVAFKAHADQQLQRENLLISQGYTKGIDGTLKAPVIANAQQAPLDPKVAEHNLRVIAQSEGIGSIADRLGAYAAKYNLTPQFVMRVTGVSITQVASVQTTDAQITGVGLEKFVSPEGDLLTVMNRTSLLRIKQNAEQALTSAITRGNTDQINFFTLQRDAAAGLLDLIPAGSERPVIEQNAQALSWKSLLERTTSDPAGLGKFAEADLRDIGFQLTPGGRESFSFELTEEAMVNITMPASNAFVRGRFSQSSLTDFELLANFSIQINNAKGEAVAYSGRDAMSGDSLSLRLASGKYSVVISDATSYPAVTGMTAEQKAAIQLPASRFNFQAKQFNSANIEGVMSIDGNPNTMPVSMRVAEFYTDTSGSLKRNDNYDGKDPNVLPVPNLDPTKPVWVVVHGMDSKPESAVMNELAKALTSYANIGQGMQVVTIDWNEAAASGNFITQDAPWTTAVGKWVTQQLVKQGFTAEKMNVVGWSHGTFIAYEMGKELQSEGKGSLNTIVALDAARNIPSFSGYTHAPDFHSVASQSIAFDSSLIAGSDATATTADYSFMVRASSEVSEVVQHKLAVTTFTSILNNHEQSGNFGNAISFSKLAMGAYRTDMMKKNVFNGGFEGVIDINVDRMMVGTGDNAEIYYKALPLRMAMRKLQDTSDTFLYFDSQNF